MMTDDEVEHEDEDWENGGGWEGYEVENANGVEVKSEQEVSKMTSMEKEWKEGRGKWIWIEKRRWMWISCG